jgi:hypothetical protein
VSREKEYYGKTGNPCPKYKQVVSLKKKTQQVLFRKSNKILDIFEEQ